MNWNRARYLKNKYGPRNKDGDNSKNQESISTDSSKAGNIKPQRFSRSRSIGSSSLSNSGNNSERWNTGENTGNLNNKETNLITSQHHQYMQKRKGLMKLGTRGSEPGAFTWPRGVAVGPDNSIVVADSSNHRVQVFDNSGAFILCNLYMFFLNIYNTTKNHIQIIIIRSVLEGIWFLR